MDTLRTMWKAYYTCCNLEDVFILNNQMYTYYETTLIVQFSIIVLRCVAYFSFFFVIKKWQVEGLIDDIRFGILKTIKTIFVQIRYLFRLFLDWFFMSYCQWKPKYYGLSTIGGWEERQICETKGDFGSGLSSVLFPVFGSFTDVLDALLRTFFAKLKLG